MPKQKRPRTNQGARGKGTPTFSATVSLKLFLPSGLHSRVFCLPKDPDPLPEAGVWELMADLREVMSELRELTPELRRVFFCQLPAKHGDSEQGF